MSISLALACIWMISANLLAMLPSRDNYWTRAYWLMGIGVPLLGFVCWENGPWLTLLVMAAGLSMLRWPIVYLMRRIRRHLGGQE
ncbi:DUF2484 family protein [Halocynthiibacter namhaensis]|uniref:DUF2484 family protein n=1 Tax=Halocynthiibacter namhaensis TaxID=1290553 RepID=UPI00057917E4|nr:DUF2484 family protein [Halocynthiibacter namhaensis]